MLQANDSTSQQNQWNNSIAWFQRLKAVNATIGSTILCVDSVVVASKGSGYARDMDFTPKATVPFNTCHV